MGLMKEIVIDRSLKGVPLEENMVVVAAYNPYRTATTTGGSNMRGKDLGKEWASGHYQVVDLVPSMKRMKSAFGSLNSDQEKEFVYRRLEGWTDQPISVAHCCDMT